MHKLTNFTRWPYCVISITNFLRLATPAVMRRRLGWDLVWERGTSSSSDASPSPPPTPTLPGSPPTLRANARRGWWRCRCGLTESVSSFCSCDCTTTGQRGVSPFTLASERKRRRGWAKPRRIWWCRREGGKGGIHWVRRRYKEVVRMVGWEDGELQLIYTFRWHKSIFSTSKKQANE